MQAIPIKVYGTEWPVWRGPDTVITSFCQVKGPITPLRKAMCVSGCTSAFFYIRVEESTFPREEEKEDIEVKEEKGICHPTFL